MRNDLFFSICLVAKRHFDLSISYKFGTAYEQVKTHQPLVYIYLKPLLAIQYYAAGIKEIESDKQKEGDESKEEGKQH